MLSCDHDRSTITQVRFTIVVVGCLPTALHTVTLKSIADFLCPVMVFYHFLYYTDTGGTLFVLLAYYFSLRYATLRSALVIVDSTTDQSDNILSHSVRRLR